MKKIFLTLTLLFAILLVSCTKDENLSAVEQAIKDAQTLTYEELLVKAKAEIGDNKLEVYGNSSALVKALDAFTESTGIKTNNNQMGDSDLYAKLVQTISSKQYSADMILAQDGQSLQLQLLVPKYAIKYIPLEFKDVLAADDLEPAAATIYLNKIFMYNNTPASGTEKLTNRITNVWQLAGTAADPGHVSGLSFKPATQENVNMNFLIMLTSSAWETKLSAAYKAYYGKDYLKPSEYKSIGYQWIAEFIKNSNTHSSDGTSVKEMAKGASGNSVLANYNKIKDVKATGGAGTEDPTNVTVAAFENPVVGFSGFVYKMYSLVASNARYPYAACAFINYITSAAGYNSAWGGLVGYYSANPSAVIATGDRQLLFWKANCVIEDPVFVASVYSDVYQFVSSQESKSK